MFALKSASIVSHLRLSTCPSIILATFSAFTLLGLDSTTTSKNLFFEGSFGITTFLSYALVPIFLWFSDGFLVCYSIHSTTFFIP
jgi:hypothetical protein